MPGFCLTQLSLKLCVGRDPSSAAQTHPTWTKSVASDANKAELKGPVWKWWWLQVVTEVARIKPWCWLHLWGQNISGVDGISCRIWALFWQNRPCCVISNNNFGCCSAYYLNAQTSRWLHGLPQILLTNSFSAQNWPESFHGWTKTLTDNTAFWVELFTASNCPKFSPIPGNSWLSFVIMYFPSDPIRTSPCTRPH